MTRTDYSQLLYAFTDSLSDEEQDFVAVHNLHAVGWQERVPLPELPRAVNLQQRAVAYLDSLRDATGGENQVTRLIIKKRR